MNPKTDVKNVLQYSIQWVILYTFLAFLKTHVRLKISISQLKLPQNRIVTYQNLS